MDIDEHVDAILTQLFVQARSQFGNAIKSFWFHGKDACPACGRRIDLMKLKGKEAMLLNAYIYRKRGVLIGYFLCGRCAEQILRAAKRNPGKQTAVHGAIEMNLEKAYQDHMNSMDA